jgi:hypothetical protein
MIAVISAATSDMTTSPFGATSGAAQAEPAGSARQFEHPFAAAVPSSPACCHHAARVDPVRCCHDPATLAHMARIWPAMPLVSMAPPGSYFVTL